MSADLAGRRLKPYRKYRDSGIEWLGKIPEGWDCAALSRFTASRCDGPFGSGLKSEHYSRAGVRVVRLQNIGWATFQGDDGAFIEEAYANQLGDHSVLEGDLLIAGLGDAGHPTGRACVAPEGLGRAIVKADCFRFRLRRDCLLPRFAAYQLSALAEAAAGSEATGATRLRMNLSSTAARKLAIPSIEEQHYIIRFLGHETARIDALVAKKERLIELLQEKRSALITQAVRKGLDPSVPMKESGVEWLGEMPAHWRLTKMWDVSRASSGGTPSKDESRYWGGDVPWVTPKDMKRRFIDSSEDSVTEAAIAEAGLKLIRAPAVLVVVRGMILAHTYPVAITRVPVTINQDMKALHLRHELDPEFFGYWLLGVGRELLAVIVDEAAHGTKAIRMDRWRVTPVQVPPLEEQHAITAFLDQESARIDALIDRVLSAIGQLEEYRTALISAAVTGKIDVRGEGDRSSAVPASA